MELRLSQQSASSAFVSSPAAPSASTPAQPASAAAAAAAAANTQDQLSGAGGPLSGPGASSSASSNDTLNLMRCVSSLLRDNQTSGAISELLGSVPRLAAPTRPAPFVNHTETATGASQGPRLSSLLVELAAEGAANSSLVAGDNVEPAAGDPLLNGFDEAQIDWPELGRKLTAIESSLPLELLGERWQFYLEIIYSLTAITSFIVNVITVIVLTRSRRSELRKYLINLSLSDLLMSLFSILTLSVFVSVATMTVIGINRHLAIMYPLKRRKYSKFQRWTIRKTHVIISIWLLGIAISLPEFLMYGVEPMCYNRQLYYLCRSSWPDGSLSNAYTIFIYMSTFVIPLSLLSYLYTSIGLKLWRRQMPGNVDVNRDLTMQTKRAKVIKMLLVVVLLFAIFWLPLQTFSMIMFLFPELRRNVEYQSLNYNIFVGTYFGFHWLGMAHSCLNPLIYCFMNDKFRSELQALICIAGKRRRAQMNSLDNYSITRLTQQSTIHSRHHQHSVINHAGSHYRNGSSHHKSIRSTTGIRPGESSAVASRAAQRSSISAEPIGDDKTLAMGSETTKQAGPSKTSISSDSIISSHSTDASQQVRTGGQSAASAKANPHCNPAPLGPPTRYDVDRARQVMESPSSGNKSALVVATWNVGTSTSTSNNNITNIKLTQAASNGSMDTADSLELRHLRTNSVQRRQQQDFSSRDKLLDGEHSPSDPGEQVFVKMNGKREAAAGASEHTPRDVIGWQTRQLETGQRPRALGEGAKTMIDGLNEASNRLMGPALSANGDQMGPGDLVVGKMHTKADHQIVVCVGGQRTGGPESSNQIANV